MIFAVMFLFHILNIPLSVIYLLYNITFVPGCVRTVMRGRADAGRRVVGVVGFVEWGCQNVGGTVGVELQGCWGMDWGVVIVLPSLSAPWCLWYDQNIYFLWTWCQCLNTHISPSAAPSSPPPPQPRCSSPLEPSTAPLPPHCPRRARALRSLTEAPRHRRARPDLLFWVPAILL